MTKLSEKQNKLQPIRLQKYLAACGISSRRKCEQIIISGRVSVNNVIIKTLGSKIQPEKDIVKLDDIIVSPPHENLYIILNKPVGYIVSKYDPHNPETIYSLLPEKFKMLFPVGRLDKNSEGLIILTNDGDFANKLIHPKYIGYYYLPNSQTWRHEYLSWLLR